MKTVELFAIQPRVTIRSCRRTRRVRYVVNPMLIGAILDHSFDGRSYVFRRDPDGSAHIAAQAARADDEEILHHRASW